VHEVRDHKIDYQERHSVFFLLYAMVLIDDRVIKSEMDLFFAATHSFVQKINYLDNFEAQALITNWFMMNYKDVRLEIKSNQRDFHLFGHAETLKDFTYKDQIFDMMKEIAVVDGEYHDDERILLEKIAKIWNLS